ncbi:hypothetical protein ANCCEY_02673 [Ancylostoma ceylanicum]|uniref:Uncharacterized protein n=1 Tax=Ancylostoma ceylanicum TaxID=53326 RepID=A0A0D6M1N3_9BILA|nr:hypothetical protein ANCCEY_02673 [Ancylostoma ceylanicum]
MRSRKGLRQWTNRISSTKESRSVTLFALKSGGESGLDEWMDDEDREDMFEQQSPCSQVHISVQRDRANTFGSL